MFYEITFECPHDLNVTGKLCVNVVSKFIFSSFTLSVETFCKGCEVAFLSSFALLKLFNSSVCNQIFSSSDISTRFQAVLRFSWVCFMVDAIGFTGVSALMSSTSYTSGATTTYFFPSAIYPPDIPFKCGPTKLPRTDVSKRAKKAPHFCTGISFLFFCDVLGFTSSQILLQFLLIFLFYWSPTLIFLLMILMTHSQIALIVSGVKCFSNSFSYPLEEQCKCYVLRHAGSTIVTLQMILFLFQCAIYTCCGSSKMLLLTRNLSSVYAFKWSIK